MNEALNNHLRAEGHEGISACGRLVDDFYLSDSAEDIECQHCKRTTQFQRIYLEEIGEEPEGES